MPDINLDSPEAEVNRRQPRYRYLNSYTDRHGHKRTYFRRGGKPQIPLPEPESSEFFEAYQNALKAVSGPQQWHRLAPGRRRRKKLNAKTGVYLLIHKGMLIYVGSSKNMAGRVMKHRTNGRPFDQLLKTRRNGIRVELGLEPL